MRKLLALAASFACAASMSLAHAAYPEKPIELIVPWPPGTEADAVGRTLSSVLSKRFKVPVQVINKPGGQGVIGSAEVLRAKPDGYTLGVLTVGPVVAQSVAGNAPYQPSDFAAIGLFEASSFVLVAKNDAPFKTIQELEAYAKSGNKQLVLGNFGPGAVPTQTVYRMAKQKGWSFKPVTFPSPGIVQLESGDADIVTPAYNTIAGALKAGQARALVSFTKERLPALPDTPTLREAGYDFDVLIWTGLFAPKGTPQEIVDFLAKTLREVVKDPAMMDLGKKLNVPLFYMDPAQTTQQLREDEAGLRPVMESLGLVKK